MLRKFREFLAPLFLFGAIAGILLSDLLPDVFFAGLERIGLPQSKVVAWAAASKIYFIAALVLWSLFWFLFPKTRMDERARR